MNWQLIVGLCLVAVPFVGVFAFLAYCHILMYGWKTTAAMYGVALIALACVLSGMVLITAGTA